MPRLFAHIHWKTVASLVGLAVLIIALWDTPLVYPLKILVVFFHEMSHGLMAVLTGGEIVQIQVVAQEGGLCLTRGGSRVLTLTAGYLGSLVWGGTILLLAARTRLDRILSVLLGITLVLITAVYVRPFIEFGFLFGLIAGLALILMGLRLPESINDYVLRLVGLISCLYAVLDIKSDVIDRPHLQSDAAMLAEVTGLPTQFWGLTWILVAGILGFLFLLISCKKPPQKASRAVALGGKSLA